MKKSKQLTSEFIAHASEHGLKFECFLIPEHAKHIIEQVNAGIFSSPGEAIFVLMLDYMERIRPRTEEEGKTFTSEEVRAHIEERNRNRKDPAVWVNDPSVYDIDGEEDAECGKNLL